jgi:hypothetical protein
MEKAALGSLVEVTLVVKRPEVVDFSGFFRKSC